MSEAEWRAAIESKLKLARSNKARRKLRLFACACCRRAWHLLGVEQSRRAIEVAERYAEGTVSKSELDQMWKPMKLGVICNSVCSPIGIAAIQAPYEASCVIAAHADRTGGIYKTAKYKVAVEDEYCAQIELLSDIFGNTLHPVTFSAVWRTDTAVSLARQMYESREFGAMPILADALQDAGCDSEDILAHCRGAGPHVRGCWVVDLVLGKE